MLPEALKLYYPVEDFSLNQLFGADPEYYSKFKDKYGNPLKGHNGLDLYALTATKCFAPVDGWAHYEKDSHGGEGIVIRTGPRTYKNAGDYFHVIHWHLIGDTDPNFPSPIPLDGKEYPVKIGDLIGYTDNTGAPYESSGAHLHFGLVPFDKTGGSIESMNGFNGCIDPTPYFTGTYAKDVPGLISKLLALVEALRKILALLIPSK